MYYLVVLDRWGRSLGDVSVALRLGDEQHHGEVLPTSLLGEAIDHLPPAVWGEDPAPVSVHHLGAVSLTSGRPRVSAG